MQDIRIRNDISPSGSPLLDELNDFHNKLENFTPHDRAVLMFIQRRGRGTEGELLLIEKKRGLGAGKYNGPGGKLEEGESYRQAAIRECREEVGLTPVNPELRGRLFFTFSDGYRMYGEVFWSYEWSGEEVETEEARPFWQSAAALPYQNMWADDRLWMPQALLGHLFSAAFYFDGDTLISSRMDMDFRSGLPAMP